MKLYHLVICHGDGLSVERHILAQKARAGGLDERERLEGLIPNPQEFHKRAIVVQLDTCNIIITLLKNNNHLHFSPWTVQHSFYIAFKMPIFEMPC